MSAEAAMPRARGRMMTGSDIVRHRDMYQQLFTLSSFLR